jgi:hypothetical protein
LLSYSYSLAAHELTQVGTTAVTGLDPDDPSVRLRLRLRLRLSLRLSLSLSLSLSLPAAPHSI